MGSSAIDNVVFKMTTGGVFTYFSPTGASADAGLFEMAADKHALYAAIAGGNHRQIASISTAGAFTLYDLPGANSLAQMMALGDDSKIWFANINGNIGTMTAAGMFATYPLVSGDTPYGPIAGPDNHMWFLDFTQSDGTKLIRAAYDGKLTYVGVPKTLLATELASGPDGLWIAAPSSARIARLNISQL